jgi:peptide methionine sulfoxide reductase MsrA
MRSVALDLGTKKIAFCEVSDGQVVGRRTVQRLAALSKELGPQTPPAQVPYAALLRAFFEAHDPTQGMRQGNDVGTQYRSAIYTLGDAQHAAALAARETYQKALAQAGRGDITTEVLPAGPFYYAEDYHQQYLAKNPGGYCGLGGLGVCFPEA